MRSLRRNQKTIYYKNLLDMKMVYDEYGNPTGENVPQYSDKKSINIYVSANTGDISSQKFGSLTDYDRVLSISDTSCEIDENSLLWIDKDTEMSHNFVVKKKSVSINETVYAIKQVTVND